MEVIVEIERTDTEFLNTILCEIEPLAVYQSDSTGDASCCSVVFSLTPDSKRFFWSAWERGKNIRIRDASKSYSVSISDRNRADGILNIFLETEQICICDASEAEAWLGRNHRIAPPMPIEIAQTRAAIFSETLDMVRSESAIEVKSFFFEGNGGTICYSPDTNTLFCDLHFWDLAWYVAADLNAEIIPDDSGVQTNPDVLNFGKLLADFDDNISPKHQIIANLIARDHLYCHGNHRKAVRFASAVKKDQNSIQRAIQSDPLVQGKIHESAIHQVEYALQRELLKLAPEKHKDIVAQVTRQRIQQWIDSFNEHQYNVERVDLTPIKGYLDETAQKARRLLQRGTWEIPLPEDVVAEYGYLVDLSDFPEDEQEQLLLEAAKKYMYNLPGYIISDYQKERMVDRCASFALILKRLFHRRLPTMSVRESMKQAIEALTIGFISERLSYISTHYRSGQNLRQFIRLEETQLCWVIFNEELPAILDAMGVTDNAQEFVDFHFDLLLSAYRIIFVVCDYFEKNNVVV